MISALLLAASLATPGGIRIVTPVREPAKPTSSAAASAVVADSAAAWAGVRALRPRPLRQASAVLSIPRPLLAPLPLAVDSPPPEPSLPPPPPPLTHYSNGYYTRLMIHRVAAFAILPLFAAQFIAGREIFNKGTAAPQWAQKAHNPLAVAVSGLFAVNTVTGVWNLWDARHDSSGRLLRTVHGVLMLIADAGFVATGITGWRARHQSTFGSGATASQAVSTRRLHKQLAYGSMGIALVSIGIMLPPLLGGH